MPRLFNSSALARRHARALPLRQQWPQRLCTRNRFLALGDPRFVETAQPLAPRLDSGETSLRALRDHATIHLLACRQDADYAQEEKGLQSRTHRRTARNRPLTERQKSANTTPSKVRARVEHVFGHQQSAMGGKIVRTIGIARARFKIGMMNLGYNIRRLVQLERMAAAPA
jgi:hypothetical protein